MKDKDKHLFSEYRLVYNRNEIELFKKTDLSNGPRDENVGVLRVRQHALGGVEEAEIGGPVDDDALDGHIEATVQPDESVALERLRQAVAQAGELSVGCALADVSCQPGENKEFIHQSFRIISVSPNVYNRELEYSKL